MKSILNAAGVALAMVSADAALAQGRPQVTVEGGVLAGTDSGGVTAFKGIPFAAPPVGPLRWRAPQPAAAWRDVRDASRYGHDCVQVYHELQLPDSAPAEDCLYLNVWRPDGARGALPVLVWIYGGGFVNGSASRPIYDGSKLARQDILVVSFNYRLGRFGTFAHPALTRARADGGLLANYGYLDQIAAMRWIKRNVAALGGDPSRITIMGESAGGMSVHNLITSPMAQGLFQQAVIASGGDGGALGAKTLADAEAVGSAFGEAQRIASDDPAVLAKLRALPAAAVLGDVRLGTMNAPGPRTFSSPFPDGRIAVSAPAAYRAGSFQHVPLIIGATSGDMGGRTGMMIKGARDLATVISATGVPTWYYRFSYVADAAPTPKSEGAIHADDLPYYFDNADVKYGAKTQPMDMAVGGTIAGYLVNFVKTGNPNGGSLPVWPAFHGPDGAMMDFSISGKAVIGKDPWRNAVPVASPVTSTISPSAG